MNRWLNHRTRSTCLLSAIVSAGSLVGVVGSPSSAEAESEWEGPVLDLVGTGVSAASGQTLEPPGPLGLTADHHTVVPALNLNRTAGTTTSVESPFTQADAESIVFTGSYRGHYAVHETDQDVTGQSPFTVSWSAATNGARAMALGFLDTEGVDTDAGIAVGNSTGTGGLALGRITLPEDALAVAFLLQDPGNAPTLGAPWSLVASQPSTGLAVYEHRLDDGGWTPAATMTTQGSTSGKGFVVFGLLPVGPDVPGVPGAPQGLAVSAVDDGAVGLGWGAPVDDGGMAVTDYLVQYRERWVGGTWATFPDGVSTATSATISGLTNYDEYEFQVLAMNEVGAGPPVPPVAATPSDGDDPDETFNRPDGPLSGQAPWTRVDPAKLSDLRIVDGHVEGTADRDGTATTYTTPVGPEVEVTIDALLGDDYSEVSAVLRMQQTARYEHSYLLQWVTDGDYAVGGTVVGPGLQIWRIDAGPTFRLLAETPLADEGERTLTFGASGSTLYIAEGDTVHLSHSDATYPTGTYIALGQSNISGGGAASQIDNMRWEALADVNVAPVAADGSVSTPEDVPVGIVLSASDADGDVLSYQVTSGPASGSLSGSGSALTYVPNPGFVGSDSFTFVANDGEFDSNVATVSIAVEAVVPVVPDLLTWAPSRTGAMRTINLTAGTSSAAPGLSFGTHAMDRDPATGLLYYFEWNTTGDEFAVWDPSTGSNTVIRTYAPAPGLFVTQMAFAPDGTLYVIDTAAGLHTIDPSTGDITTLGPITGLTSGPHGQVGDLAFAPDGTAYVATYGELYTLDVGTRTATRLHGGMFGSASDGWFGLAHCDGALYGASIRTTNGRSAIYSIDVATGATSLVHQLTTYVTDLTGCALS